MGLLKKRGKGRRQRSYGVVLDGGSLSWAAVEDGQAVEHDQLALQRDNAAALEAWLAQVDPREPVTVAVMSRQQETADVELPASMPSDDRASIIEAEAAPQFRKDAGAFAVVAALGDSNGGAKTPAHVFGIPEGEMQQLWAIGKSRPLLRFTLPAMALAIDGVHLALYPHTAELFAVVGGRTRAAYVLRDTGPSHLQEATEAEQTEYAERVAYEAHMVITDWTRKRTLPTPVTRVHLTGPGAINSSLHRALDRCGYQPALDHVSDFVDLQPLVVADGNRGQGVLLAGLAAAAAVADLGQDGVLKPPGRPVAVAAKTRRRRKEATPEQRKAVLGAAAAVVLIVAAGVAVPRLLGTHELSTARGQVSTATAQMASLQPEITLYDNSRRLSAAKASVPGVQWQSLVNAITATQPPGIAIGTMTLSIQGGSVAVAAAATANPATTLPVWLANLAAKHVPAAVAAFTVGNSSAGSGTSAAQTTTAAHFTITFTVPKDFR